MNIHKILSFEIHDAYSNSNSEFDPYNLALLWFNKNEFQNKDNLGSYQVSDLLTIEKLKLMTGEKLCIIGYQQESNKKRITIDAQLINYNNLN